MKTQFSIIALLICSVLFAQDQMYVHTATTDNITDNVTYLDHPDLNGNPSACLNYVHNWNPSGGGGIYNDNADGLWYNLGNSRWAIYNEVSATSMIEGVSFNVYIADDGQCIDHVATAANIFGHITDIDDANFNGSDPGPYAFFNTYYNPNGIYNPGIWGMYYDTGVSRRSIYDENINTVPEGAAFKIAIPGASTTRFTHTTSVANNDGNYTIIDHPELNGNPDATFIFMHYWGVNGGDTEVYLTANTSAWYTGSNWSIFTEDITDMPVGVAFDIAIGQPAPLGVTENTVLDSVNMYPNPASDVLTISSPEYSIKELTVYSILGTEVMHYDLDISEKTINVSSLSAGTYLIKVVAENSIKTMKFIKL